jgi:hypothetical protein
MRLELFGATGKRPEGNQLALRSDREGTIGAGE